MMLRYFGVLLLAATLVAAGPISKTLPSQPPPASAGEQSGPVQKPAAADKNDGKQYERATNDRPLIVETYAAPDGETKARQEAEYQEHKAADETARKVGIASIIVGAVQAIALVITFWIIAFVASRQLRAYIYGDIEKFTEFKIGGRMEAHLTWINGGQTPARDFEARGTIFYSAIPLPDNLTINLHPDSRKQKHSKIAVFPNSPQTTRTSNARQEIPPNLIADIRAKKITVYIYSEVTYRDMFWRRHKTQICKFIEPVGLIKVLDAVEGKPVNLEDIKVIWADSLNHFT